MPYCLYVRKSRADAEAEARGEGETLTRHINTLLDLAKRRKFDIAQIYREIVSGETIASRPVMQQVLQEVELGMWDGVLVMEVERLARGDTIDQGIVAQTFKFSGTKIITPNKDYDPDNEFDEEYFEFGLFMSRREYKTINRRLQSGRSSSIKEGKYVGSQSPFGYDRVRLVGDKGFTLTPNPAEADIVRLIYSLYTRGEEQDDGSFRRLGVNLIARRLNKMKIRPRKSDSWSVASIRDILINPVYIGKIRWNWRPTVKKMSNGKIIKSRPRDSVKCFTVDGKHPPLIDAETFNIAQDFMSQNPPRPIGERNIVKNPLAGLVYCGKCGLAMTRRPYGDGYPDTLMCANTNCDNISSHLHIVEKRILQALAEWLSAYRLKWEEAAPVEDNLSTISVKEKALRRLVTECETLKKQLENAHDLLEQGIYTTDQFLERSRNLSARIKQNEADRIALGADVENEKARDINRKLVIPKVERLLEVYEALPSPKEKNDMLKEVLEKVVYLKTKKGTKYGPTDNFELTLFPRIPMAGDNASI